MQRSLSWLELFASFLSTGKHQENRGGIPNEFKKGKSTVDPDVDFRLQFSSDCG